jgi:FAD synthase
LREERRFEDLDALGAQITLDVEDARRALTESCTTD